MSPAKGVPRGPKPTRQNFEALSERVRSLEWDMNVARQKIDALEAWAREWSTASHWRRLKWMLTGRGR